MFKFEIVLGFMFLFCILLSKVVRLVDKLKIVDFGVIFGCDLMSEVISWDIFSCCCKLGMGCGMLVVNGFCVKLVIRCILGSKCVGLLLKIL